MDSQLLKGVLPLLLLRVLGQRETYGYDLVVTLRGQGLTGMSTGTVYPALARLERRGDVVSALAPSAAGPARKYYRITDQGAATMRTAEAAWRQLRTVVDGLLAATSPTDSTPSPEDPS